MKIIFILIPALLMTGCANTPVSNSEARPVSDANILDASFFNPFQNSATVIVKRDAGFAGSACSSRVFVNAKPVADLHPAEKAVIYLKSGKYILSAIPNGICSGGIAEIEASVNAGDQMTYRIGYSGTGDYYIKPTAF